jgi:malonyl-CoA O-methyltransferase
MADNPAAERSSRRPIDEQALAQVLQRLARAPAAPWLHAEAARRMAERLPVIKLQPDRVLDWWAQLGGGASALAAAYPRAHIDAVEVQAAPVDVPPWWTPRRWASRAPVVLAESAVVPGAAQLVWANMMLHLTPDPQAVMQQWQRALAVDGFLMFSTLGPGTLERLRALYRGRDWAPPFAPFVDMHDLGDMLVHAGFADPVMDQETMTLTWADGDALLRELRTLGGNVDPARHTGLRTPRWRSALLDLLATTAGADARPALQFELVFGHAFKPLPSPRVRTETNVPLDDLRAMVRTGRRRP